MKNSLHSTSSTLILERNDITVAVTDRGKISVITYDLKSDGDRFYFEYGVMCDKIKVDDFEEADE